GTTGGIRFHRAFYRGWKYYSTTPAKSIVLSQIFMRYFYVSATTSFCIHADNFRQSAFILLPVPPALPVRAHPARPSAAELARTRDLRARPAPQPPARPELPFWTRAFRDFSLHPSSCGGRRYPSPSFRGTDPCSNSWAPFDAD